MKILVALGGNAILQRKGTGSPAEQLANVDSAAKQLAKILKEGHTLALTHGNGPQVGDILLAGEMAKDVVPPMPLDVCGAESQGMIGYMMQQALENELKRAGSDTRVVTVVSQTLVDEGDPAFSSPTKPIGPFYDAAEAKRLGSEKGWKMAKDSNRGFRRVVPSPEPIAILEESVIKSLFEAGAVVIALGGGGIPVVRDRKTGLLRGVEAVIDKDLGAALLAKSLDVDLLMILTDVEGVALDYGKPTQRLIEKLSESEASRLMNEGQFASGSMAPKVEAAMRFVRGSRKKAIIASLAGVQSALEGKSGTLITAD